MKRRTKISDDHLYRHPHKMTDEQLVAALHELADQIEGQALIASKSPARKRLAARILADLDALETREQSEGEGDG